MNSKTKVSGMIRKEGNITVRASGTLFGSTLVFMVAILAAHACLPICAFGQSDNAQISGFVKDPAGAAVSAAKIIVKSQTKGGERSGATNEQGYYVISNLPPDYYSISVEHPGFKLFKLADKKLDPSIATTVDVSLEVGQVSEIVSVTASTSAVQTETATLGKLIDRKEIELTELNGRNPIFLALTKPGVSGGNIASNNFGLTTGGFNINGGRVQNNMIFFDGAVGIRTRSNATFSIGTADLDATQEVQVLTANYNAEYGRSSSGQIRVVSKSGSKDFHGVLYEYLRNSAINANSWSRKTNTTGRSCDQFPTDQQCRPSPFRYNQYGYYSSGPVLLPISDYQKYRTRLFWSWSQEWVKQRTSTLRTLVVPTLKMRQGDFSELAAPNLWFSTPRFIKDPLKSGPCGTTNQTGCFSDGGIINKIPTNRMSANGMALLKALPEPVSGFTGTSGTNWFADKPNSVDQLKNTLSIDFYPTDKQQIRFRAQKFGSTTMTAFPFGGDPGYTPRIFGLPNKWFSINWVWSISPTLINEALIASSADRVNTQIELSKAQFQRSQYGINYPYIFPEGKEITDKIPTTAGLGPFAVLDGGPYPSHSSGMIHQISDNLTNIRGNHTVKLGVYFERSGENDFDQINVSGTPGGTNNQNGRFSFSDTTAGGTGTAITNAAIGLFDTYAELGQRSYSPYRGQMLEWFVQDSWKATSKMRLEFGLRHSIVQPYYSLWRNIVVFDARFYDSGHVVTQDPTNGFITGGDLKARYNGLVIPGRGWPDAASGRVPIADSGEFDFLFRRVSKSYSETHHTNFQPRLGIAYAFNAKNVIRAGGGRFIERLGVSDSVFLGGNPPLQPSASVTSGVVDNPGGKPGNAFPFQITSQDPIFPNPEAWIWNVSYQREIGFATTVEISYVGRKGLHLQRERNINQLTPGTVNPGGTYSGANPDPLRPFKGYQVIRVTNNDASSFYNGLQLEIKRRLSRGLYFGIAYTYSKSSDDGSGQRDVIPNAYDANTLWGSSDFDRRHLLAITVIHELPFLKNASNLIGKLLGGWSINATSTLRTGSPFSVTTNQDFAGVGPGSGNQYWIVNGSPLQIGRFSNSNSDQNYWYAKAVPGGTCSGVNAPDCAFTQPVSGTFSRQQVRNMFYNPGDQFHNLGVFKDFNIREQHRLQFRAEAFNWPNHPNLPGIASNDPASANFMRINTKSGERELQFALRYSF